MFTDPASGRPMKTWNVFVGCKHDCTYCSARRTALTRLKHHLRYKNGFDPHLVPELLTRGFNPGEFVFVAYMGDISFATREEFLRIRARIMEFPQTDFLIQTRNPRQLFDWRADWGVTLPAHVYLGTTIETNRNPGFSKAPSAVERFRYLTGYPHNRKFLSIEPIMDFDFDTLISWVGMIQPNIIEVGADNYHNHLPEPPWWKVEALLKRLRELCPAVVEKPGLERLRGLV
ncbi:hypothetical protein ES707_19869 [subsurface metagenome]